MSDNFDNILNFRDVGKTINEFLGSKCVDELPTKKKKT